MKHTKCPHCGSTKLSQSPSGEHQQCLSCQRILVAPRARNRRREDDGKDAVHQVDAVAETVKA